VAIVLLAGHGQREPGKPFRFLAQDTKPGGGVTDQEINDALSRAACRTILLLDTCHSGQAVEQQQLQNWPGMGLGPMVVAACRAGEESSESDSLQVGDLPPGHGVFTATLLEALTGRCALSSKLRLPNWDPEGNGMLEVGDLFEFLEARAPQLCRLLNVKPQNSVSVQSITFADADSLALMPAHPIPAAED
jgi:hypothetical protein